MICQQENCTNIGVYSCNSCGKLVCGRHVAYTNPAGGVPFCLDCIARWKKRVGAGGVGCILMCVALGLGGMGVLLLEQPTGSQVPLGIVLAISGLAVLVFGIRIVAKALKRY